MSDPLSETVFLNRPPDFNPIVEVVGVFLEANNKILLLHRQDHKVQGNKWGIPGGKLEKAEDVLQAAIRETLEETGFDISPLPLTHLRTVYIRNPYCDYVYHMVKCYPKEEMGSVKINFLEHKGFTWITPKDALRMDLMDDEGTCFKLAYGIP